MNSYGIQKKRTTWVWIALILLTLVTYALGKMGFSGRGLITFLLFSIFLKGHWIIAEYMGLRQVARKWRWLVHGWLIVVISFIAVAYR